MVAEPFANHRRRPDPRPRRTARTIAGRDGRRRLGAVILILAIGLVSCTPGGPAQPKPGAKDLGPPAIPITVAVVAQGTIAATLVYSGNVQARAQVNVVPRITGRIERLTVDIGDQVAQGDIIAELDRGALDSQVQQAEAGVAVAQARLAQVQAGARDEDIQAAEAVVRAAQVRLEQARSGARPEEIEAARAQLGQAQARLEQARAGARVEEIDAARAQVGQAQSRLDALLAGPEREELDQLDAAVDQARAQQEGIRAQLASSSVAMVESRYRLDQAKAGLGGPNTRAEDIASAQASLNAARSRLDQLRAGTRPEDLRAAELGVDRARANLIAAEEALENCGRSTSETRTESQSRQRSNQTDGSNRSATETISRQRQSCTETQRDQLTAARNVARVARREAENQLERARNGSTPFDITQAQEAVRQAEATLQRTRFGGTTDLATLELRYGQAQTDVERLQAQLEQAQAGLDAAQARVDAARNPSPFDVRNAQEVINQAGANLSRLANPSPFDVRNAEEVVAQSAANLARLRNANPFDVGTAQAALDQAQAQLAVRLRPTAEDILIAAAQLDQAAASLEAARVNQAESIIRAPFSSIVSQRLVSLGATVSPQTPIVTLVSRDTEIVLQVEEARVGQVAQGQSALVSVAAFPGETFPGIVASVAPTANPQSRTFPVRILPNDPLSRLRDGMFAQVSLQTAERQALVVPVQAVVNRSGRNLVFVVTPDSRVQAREVSVGISDGRQIEIAQGLNPNEEVATSALDVLSDGTPVIVQR